VNTLTKGAIGLTGTNSQNAAHVTGLKGHVKIVKLIQDYEENVTATKGKS